MGVDVGQKIEKVLIYEQGEQPKHWYEFDVVGNRERDLNFPPSAAAYAKWIKVVAHIRNGQESGVTVMFDPLDFDEPDKPNTIRLVSTCERFYGGNLGRVRLCSLVKGIEL